MTALALRPGRTALTAAAALAAAATAVVSAFAIGGGSHTLAVLALAAVAGVLVAVLALTRFAAYVLLMLAVRPCLDLFKLSGPTAGTAGDGGAARALDPSTLVGVLFLLAAGLWLAAQARAGKRGRTSPLGLALLLVAATGAVSALGSARPYSSALEVLRILTVVAMFLVLEQLLPRRAMVRRVLVAVYLSLALVLAYTLLASLLGSPPAEVKGSFTRISGPFSQSTTFGRYLMFMVIFGCGIYRFLGHRAKVCLGTLLVLSLGFLALTNTRGAILGAAIGLLVVAALHRSARLVLALALAAVATVVVAPGVADRFAQLGAAREAGGGPTGNTLAWRTEYWSQVITLANRNPVTGIGPNMTQRETDEAKKPHNDFLRAYVETGVLAGLLAYLGMILLCLHAAALAVRRAPPDTLHRGIAVGFAGCAVAFVAVSAASNVISNVVTLWYFVAFAAMAGTVAAATGPGRPARGASESEEF